MYVLNHLLKTLSVEPKLLIIQKNILNFSLGIFLTMFLICYYFQPGCSYKMCSYKKRCNQYANIDKKGHKSVKIVMPQVDYATKIKIDEDRRPSALRRHSRRHI